MNLLPRASGNLAAGETGRLTGPRVLSVLLVQGSHGIMLSAEPLGFMQDFSDDDAQAESVSALQIEVASDGNDESAIQQSEERTCAKRARTGALLVGKVGSGRQGSQLERDYPCTHMRCQSALDL